MRQALLHTVLLRAYTTGVPVMLQPHMARTARTKRPRLRRVEYERVNVKSIRLGCPRLVTKWSGKLVSVLGRSTTCTLSTNTTAELTSARCDKQ